MTNKNMKILWVQETPRSAGRNFYPRGARRVNTLFVVVTIFINNIQLTVFCIT